MACSTRGWRSLWLARSALSLHTLSRPSLYRARAFVCRSFSSDVSAPESNVMGEDPVHGDPGHSDPVHSDPVHSDPAFSDPAYIDPAILCEYKDKRLLRSQHHPALPITVWNYSGMCTFTRAWDHITRQCRGLVVEHETGRIIARSFPKFWEHGVDPQAAVTETFEVVEKLDGSMIIVFYYADQWIACSRGSFVSSQAQKATQLLKKYDLTQLDKGTSYVLELISPDNRIVISYGDREELVFIAAFLPSGSEVYPVDKEQIEKCGFAMCPSFPSLPLNELKKLNLKNKEGFIVRFSSGQRVKIKFDDYMELHGICTNASGKGVWEHFKSGGKLEELVDKLPNEFHDWLRVQWASIQLQYDTLLERARTMVDELFYIDSQKEFLDVTVNHNPKFRSLMLAVRADKPLFHIVCRALEGNVIAIPRHESYPSVPVNPGGNEHNDSSGSSSGSQSGGASEGHASHSASPNQAIPRTPFSTPFSSSFSTSCSASLFYRPRKLASRVSPIISSLCRSSALRDSSRSISYLSPRSSFFSRASLLAATFSTTIQPQLPQQQPQLPHQQHSRTNHSRKSYSHPSNYGRSMKVNVYIPPQAATPSQTVSSSSSETVLPMTSISGSPVAAAIPRSRVPTITLLIGIAGSGKSTRAKALFALSPQTCIIVSRDLLRAQLFGYADADHAAHYEMSPEELRPKEDLVTACQEAQIQAAVDAGLDVIVDDTNLRANTIRRMRDRFCSCNFKHEVIECTVDEAQARNAARRRQVDRSTILAQSTNLHNLVPMLPTLLEPPPVNIFNNPALPKAVVVDMDGTLALLNGRNPYVSEGIKADLLNTPVREAILALKDRGHSVIVCTGRRAEALKDTADWLHRFQVPFSMLYIRKPGDSRPDFVVKEEMWRDIVTSFYVAAMFDDRNSVVRHARRAGFSVFQVNEGNF